MLIDGNKWACEACIRGHRVTSCKHKDRSLRRINKKGRPSKGHPEFHGSSCIEPKGQSTINRNPMPGSATNRAAGQPSRWRSVSNLLPIAPRPAAASPPHLVPRQDYSKSNFSAPNTAIKDAESTYSSISRVSCYQSQQPCCQWVDIRSSEETRDAQLQHVSKGIATEVDAQPAEVGPKAKLYPGNWLSTTYGEITLAEGEVDWSWIVEGVI